MGAAFCAVLIACALLHSAQAVRVPVADGKALVPADTVNCTATRESPRDVPVVDCTLAEEGSEERTFAVSTVIDVSGTFARCNIFPRVGINLSFDCTPFAATPLDTPVIEGRTATIPAGAVSCEITGLTKCPTPTPVAVNCKGARPSETVPRFGEGTVFEFPEGDVSRCDITAGPDGEVEQNCVGVPLVQIADPSVSSDNEILLPAGAISCDLTPGEADDDEPVFNCIAGVPGCDDVTFVEGASVPFPETTFTECSIVPGESGEGEISCKVPNQVPVIENGVVMVPEGATSCTVTGLEECDTPVAVRVGCQYPAPNEDVLKFTKNVVFPITRGFTECKLTPDDAGELVEDCTPTPAPETLFKGKIIGRNITLLAGSASCTATPRSRQDRFTLRCNGPAQGCEQPVFEVDTAFEIAEEFNSCSFTPGEGGPNALCTNEPTK